MEKITFYMETYGCQMNVAESNELSQMLINSGLTRVHDPLLANAVIINTCSVRNTAEQRIIGRLGYFKNIKDKNDIKIIVFGCMAQGSSELLIEKAPFIDAIVGTNMRYRIPLLLSTIEALGNGNPQLLIDQDQYIFTSPVPDTDNPFSANISIIHGCNNYCSYCIVPYVRGREVSRNSNEVISNIKFLADKGVKEVILLGQNVNSYGKDNNDISFAKLLYKISKIDEISRIRFLTSHPKDFSDELIDVISSEKKVCKQVHLPLQSASDNVLNLMNRKYTFSQYYDIIYKLREKVKEPLSISTDILVGFPGESHYDFEDTLNAVRKIRFDDAFMFYYNIRPGTKAADFADNIPKEEKLSRLQTIIDNQNKIRKEILQSYIGKRAEVLLERISKKDENQLTGRSDNGHRIVVEYPKHGIGQIVDVKIVSLSGNTFIAEAD